MTLLTALQERILLDIIADPAFVGFSSRLAACGLHLAVYEAVGAISIPRRMIDAPLQTANDGMLPSRRNPIPHVTRQNGGDRRSNERTVRVGNRTGGAAIRGTGPVHDCFPDQGQKLRYLIKKRGDQRERSEKNPMRAKDGAIGGHQRDTDSPIVINQDTLATFLRASPAEVSRWCSDKKRFPDRLLPELCRLYAVSEQLFRIASFEKFVAECEAPDVS